MLQTLGILGGMFAAVSYVPYVHGILKGKIRPERASFFIWTILAAIAFTSQLASGASDSLWLAGFDGAGVLVVFGLSFKFGIGGLAKRDGLAMFTAAAGLTLWYITRQAAVALLLTIFIDAVATVLTVIKTYEQPYTETYIPWSLAVIAGLLAAFAVGKINPILLAYPIYIFLANVAVVVAIFTGRRRPGVKIAAAHH